MNDVKKLLTQAANGDDESLTEFIQIYRPMMIKFARLYINTSKNIEDIEDIVQNVCLKLFRYREALADVDNVENWLFYVIRNNCYDEIRKAKNNEISFEYNESFVDSVIHDTDILDIFINKETNRKISQYINELPDGLKYPVLMYYFNNLSIDEIGKALKIPYTTAKWRLHSARLKLKEKIIREKLL